MRYIIYFQILSLDSFYIFAVACNCFPAVKALMLSKVLPITGPIVYSMRFAMGMLICICHIKVEIFQRPIHMVKMGFIGCGIMDGCAINRPLALVQLVEVF